MYSRKEAQKGQRKNHFTLESEILPNEDKATAVLKRTVRVSTEWAWIVIVQRIHFKFLRINPMKRIVILSLMAALLFGSGCMVYMDKPAKRTISGQVISEDNGEPVPHAVLWFYSERNRMGIATNYGIDATVHADKDGRFALNARLRGEKVTVVVYKNGVTQTYTLEDPFAESNTLENIVWKIKYTGEPQ